MITRDVALRPATVDDLDAVVDVFVACWTISYAGFLPVTPQTTMSRHRATELWRTSLRAPSATTVVAVDDGTVVGVARWSGSDIHSLYVDPAHQGRRIGMTLLDAATAAISATGASTAKLWTFAANDAAINFYVGRGWESDGSTNVTAEFGELEVGFVKALP